MLYIYMNLGFVFSGFFFFFFLSKADDIYPEGFKDYFMKFLKHM